MTRSDILAIFRDLLTIAVLLGGAAAFSITMMGVPS